jgi:hypothetical protein
MYFVNFANISASSVCQYIYTDKGAVAVPGNFLPKVRGYYENKKAVSES